VAQMWHRCDAISVYATERQRETETTMRVQILSDLHVDAGGLHRPMLAVGVELLIVAGDVCAGPESGFQMLRHHVPAPTPIVMVAGNHEFYGFGYADELARARKLAATHHVQFLDNDAVIIGGVRFVGATLWTDYALFGADKRDQCMLVANQGLNDHRLIGLTQARGAVFKPVHALTRHLRSRAYLDATLATPHAGPTVVVTHHAPHPMSVHPRFRDSQLTAAFVSDLEPLILARRPALWVHGHTHSSFDYMAGATRIICNPAGYGAENPGFDPALVVQI
jgi:Icc-related predicted phosphoesterase